MTVQSSHIQDEFEFPDKDKVYAFTVRVKEEFYDQLAQNKFPSKQFGIDGLDKGLRTHGQFTVDYTITSVPKPQDIEGDASEINQNLRPFLFIFTMVFDQITSLAELRRHRSLYQYLDDIDTPKARFIAYSG